MKKKSFSSGDLLRINDSMFGCCYFAVSGRNGDYLLLDFFAKNNKDIPSDRKYLCRIFISLASIRAENWELIKAAWDEGVPNECGKYINRPAGSEQYYVYDNCDASLHIASRDDLERFSDLTVWDAGGSILTFLRGYFFEKEWRFASEIKRFRA